MTARFERLARISLLTGAALAALLFARQGRDYKALSGMATAIVALLATLIAISAGLDRLATLHNCLPSRGRLTGLWTLLLIPVGGYMALQAFGMDPVEEFVKFHSSDRPFSTFGNPDFLAAFLGMMLPIQLGRWKRDRQCFFGWFPLAIGALLIQGLVWTGSRGGWLGAAVGTTTWCWIEVSRSDWKSIYRFWTGIGVVGNAVLILLLVGLSLSGLPSEIRTALDRRTDRTMLWEGTIRMIRVKPVAGWGPGRFAAEYPPFAPPAFAQRMKEDNTFAEHPHSEYLHIWVETGAVGLGLFLWMLTIIIRQGIRLARAGHPVAGGIAGGLIAVLVHIAVDRNFRLASTAVPFWTAAAALWSRRSPDSRPLGFAAPAPAVLFLALLPALALGAWTFRPLLASYRVEREGDFLKQAADVPAVELEKRRNAMQADPQYWIALGNAWAKEKQFGRAADAFREGLRRDPGSLAAANNLGNSLFMMSRFEEAAAVYRGMLTRDPLHKDARFNLAFTYYHQRRIKEALAEVAILLRQDPANAKALALKEQLNP